MKIIILGFFVGALIILGFFFAGVFQPYYQGELEYELNYGRDLVTYFGNGRFQLWGIDDYSISDGKTKHNIAIVERYVIEDNLIFIKGIVTSGYTVHADGSGMYKAYNVNTEEVEYENFEDLPRYVILNYKDETAEYYVNIEDVPDEYKEYFTSELPDRCKPLFSCLNEELDYDYYRHSGELTPAGD